MVDIPAMNITAAMSTILFEINIFFIFGRLPSFLPYAAFVKLKGVGVNHKIKLATIALVVVERFRGNQWDMHNFELKRSQMTVIYTPDLYL